MTHSLELVADAGLSAGAAKREYTIGDLAREFGVTLRTLRFYEDRGLLTPRRQGMARYYDATQKARLSVIVKGKTLGFTLAEIQNMLAEGDSAELPSNLNLSVSKVDEQIAHLERQRADIDRAINELKAQREALSSSMAA